MLRLFLAWAATTRNNDYIRMEGLKRLVGSSKHRKEFVAGGLFEYITAGGSNPLLYNLRPILIVLGRLSQPY